MVRRFWQNRLIQGLWRLIRLRLRWLFVWLGYLLRRTSRNLTVMKRVLTLLVRPRDPNNLFLGGNDASHEAAETTVTGIADIQGDARTTLLWAGAEQHASGALDASAVSLWRGRRKVAADEGLAEAEAANRRYSYVELLASQIKRLPEQQMALLDEMIERLARKWLDLDDKFEWLPRRNRLDIGRTLRHNIPRYAGQILNFRWATKERPVPQLAKPARILVVGDVSHSMVHYVTVVLYFLHRLNFHFLIDSYVFSEKVTHSAPFLNGVGTFAEKVQRLVAGAKSWNAGTRFGSALEEIAGEALVDENTYVIIATDGKVSLQGGEPELIERHMTELRHKAKQVIFLTPSAEFADGTGGKVKPERIGSLKYAFHEIPIFAVGPPLWYGTLGKYADRLYLIRTVQDLVDMTEDLLLASRRL
ncbi:MAG TPA: VWA domain-containing protein [Symbiobacteriaceae bacterium]|nr:VWA domain-containing protein [Symbiobacteriaceae bacterium]